MSMAELLETLGTMQKSLSADQDDNKIAAAAAASGAGGAEANGGAGTGDDDDDDENDDDPAAGGANGGQGGQGGDQSMAKSFSFTLDDGTVIDAMDGTELLKAMGVQLQATHKVAADAGAAAASAAQAIAAAEGGFTEVLKKSMEVMAQQGELIKSLQAEVKALGAQGRGRRGIATPADGSEALRKSLEADQGKGKGVPPQEFLAKCLSAQREGRVSFMDVATAEAAINNGSPVPQHIVSKVLV